MKIETEISNNSYKKITEPVRWQVIGNYECFQDQKQTADHYQVNQSTVSRIFLQKARNINDVSDQQRSGLPSKIPEIQEEQITQYLKKINILQLMRLLLIQMCVRGNIQKYYMNQGFHFQFLRKYRNQILDISRKQIYDHSKLLINKDLDDIIFTNESYFQLFHSTLCV
ncbi:hypothetical protein ABPG72_014029 [Tetrahymena utriculariae]